MAVASFVLLTVHATYEVKTFSFQRRLRRARIYKTQHVLVDSHCISTVKLGLHTTVDFSPAALWTSPLHSPKPISQSANFDAVLLA